VPLPTPISTFAIFAIGADPLRNPQVDPPIHGASDSVTVTPVLYIPEKEVATRFDDGETVTGPNYPVTYTLSADISAGATIDNFAFSETLPENLHFTGITAITLAGGGDPDVVVTFIQEDATALILYSGPLSGLGLPLDGPVTTPPGGDPGGSFAITFSAVTGTPGEEDVVVVYEAYVPENDTTGAPVVGPLTGADASVTNTATASATGASGDFGTVDLTGQDVPTEEVTIAARNIALQKGVEVVSDNATPGLSPLDEVEFTLEAQVSDYFTHDQIAVQDILGDGYTFVPGSASITFATENGTPFGTPFTFTEADITPAPDLSDGGYPFPAAGTLLVTQDAQPGSATGADPGFTTLTFDISAFLGELAGGAADGASAATGYTTGIADDTRFTLTFRATIDTEYENAASYTLDASIDALDIVQNDALVSGQLPSSAFDTNGDASEQQVPSPTFDKALVAHNDAAVSGPVEAQPLDTLTFALTLTIPAGSLEELQIVDFLPLPVLEAIELTGGAAGTIPFPTGPAALCGPGEFPAAGAVCFGPATTNNANFDPLANPPTITTNAAENNVTFAWPSEIAFEPDAPAEITVQVFYTVTITIDPFDDRLFLTNVATANFAGSNETASSTTDTAGFTLREPALVITKGISFTDGAGTIAPPPDILPVDGDLTNADAGDLVRYVITVENTGGSPTYEVTVTDPPVAGLTGCTVVSVTDGTGATLATTSADLTTGIVLTDPLAVNDGTVGPPYGADTALITVECTLDAVVAPGQVIENTASITHFTNVPGGPNFVNNPLAFQDMALVTVASPAVDKTITATDQAHTAGNTVAIGEIATYQVVITVPEGASTPVTFTDTLDQGLAIVAVDSVTSSSPSLTWTGAATPVVGAAPVGSTSPLNAGRLLTLDFGTVTNAGTDDGVDETITIVYRVVVLDSTNNNRGSGRNNTARWSWTANGAAQSVSDAAPNLTIVEPTLQVVKDITPATADAADTVTITITVSHTGASNEDAFDVVLADTLPDGLTYVPGTLANVSGQAATLDDSAAPTISASWTTLPDNTNSVISFQATVDDDVVSGTVLTNSATVDWTSLPGEVPGPLTPNSTLGCERTAPGAGCGGAADDYRAMGSDTVAIVQPVIGKQLIDTSEDATDPGDTMLAGNPPVAVGEVLTYTLAASLAEGVTNSFSLVDLITPGQTLLSAELMRTSTALTSSTNPGGINASAPGTFVPVTPAQSGDVISGSLGNVTNSDTDPTVTEGYVLRLRFVVANVAGNVAGTNLVNTGYVRFETADGTPLQVELNSVSVHVAEPIVAVQKTADPLNATGGQVVTFTLTISNQAAAGSLDAAPAFDYVVTDPLPAGYVAPFTVTGTDTGATGATVDASFTANELSVTVDRLDPGESVTVTYAATIDPAILLGSSLVNTAAATASSLPGPNGASGETPGDPGSPTGERTGSGGINSYFASDSATVNIGIPSLDKTLVAPQQYYAIGETATYQVLVGMPVGTVNNAIVTDTLAAGLVYVPGSLVVTLPPNGSSSNAPLTEANPDFFTYDAGAGTLTFDFGTSSLLTAGNVVLTYTVQVDNVIGNQQSTTLPNSVEGQFDDPENPGATVTVGPVSTSVRVGEPDLEMSKSIVSGATGADAGDTVTWQVTIENTGTTTAFQTSWVDQLPDGLGNISNASLTTAGTVYLNGTTTPVASGDLVISTTTNTDDTIGLPPLQLAPGGSVTIVYDSLVLNTVTPGQVLVNDTSATYTSLVDGGRDASDGGDDDDDSTLNNYQESATASLTASAFIAIVKTVEPNEATIGEEVTFTIRILVQEGTTPALVVTDVLPVGLTYTGHSISAGNAGMSPSNPDYNTRLGSGQTVQFNAGDLLNPADGNPLNDFFTIAITARVDNIASNQNGVVLSNGDAAAGSPVYLEYGSTEPTRVDFDADFDPANGQQGVPVTVIEPELNVTKTVDPATQSLGDIVTFTVRVEHTPTSTSDAFDIVLHDTLPAGLTYVDGSASLPPADVTASGQELEFRIATLSLDAGFIEFTYQAQVDLTAPVGQPLVNDLQLTWASLPGATGAPDGGRTGAGGVNDYVDTASATVTAGEAAVIDATKTVEDLNGAPVLSGDVLEYTITLVNTNDTALTGVVFTDPIPADTTYVDGSLTSTVGETDDSGDPLVVNIGTLEPGQSVTITFQVTVNPFTPAGTVISNQGSVDSDETVPEPTDEDGNDDNGDQPTDVIVDDVTEASVRAEKSVALTGDVVAPAGTINVGDEVTYTIVIMNTGSTDLTNVNFADTFPDAVTVTGTSPNASFMGQTVTASFDVIPAGASETITVTGTANAVGTHVNQGVVDSDETEPTMTDGNTDPSDGEQPTVIVVVDEGEEGAPQLVATKTVAILTETNGDGLLNPGESIRYTIVVQNQGSTAATNVVLTDELPDEYTTLGPGGVTTSQGIVVTDFPTLTVNIGTLEPGASATITVDLVVNADTPSGTELVNQGTVTDAEGDEVITDDSTDDDGVDCTSETAGNCNDADTANDDPTTIPVVEPPVYNPPAGIKTVDSMTWPDLTWRVVWINSGNNTPLTTLVTDPIPANTTYVDGSLTCEPQGSSVTVTCAYEPTTNTIIWEGTLGPDLGATDEATAANEVVITFQTTAAQGVASLENQACAQWDADGDGFIGDDVEAGQPPVCSDDPDTPDPDDPTDWLAPDLTIDKTGPPTLVTDSNATFTFTVTNAGGGPTSQPIVVTDTLPPGLEFVSASGDGWTCDYAAASRTITCTHPGPLAPAQSLPPITVVVLVTEEALPSITNTVVVDEPSDPDPSDNEDTIIVPVEPGTAPDLAIEKSHEGTFRVDEVGTYVLTVTNVGSEPAVGTITVTDTLPAGLEFISASGDGWTCDYDDASRTITCTWEGTLDVGESLSIEVVVRATEEAYPGVINVATVDFPDDDNPDNNTDEDETVVEEPDPTPVPPPTPDCFTFFGGGGEGNQWLDGPFADGAQEVYYAAVGNADDFGMGAAQTSITVQNLDVLDGYIYVFTGTGSGWEYVEYAYLSAGASKTFTATELGIGEGEIVPVVVIGYNKILIDENGDCFYKPIYIVGLAKQVVAGRDLPYTTTADTSVSGYNAVSGREVGFFDQLYLPIVQTNCGPGGCWNTMLRVANVGQDQNAAVTVRFFPADDGSGSLHTGFQVEALVNVGQTWSINLGELVPDGWVGSAHILTDDAVVAIADRFKVGTDMWITNTAADQAAELTFQDPIAQGFPYVLFAPDVRMDFNGWNTGINVANLVDADNNVNIQYFGNDGNAPQGESRRLAPHGMTYFYNPSDPSEDDCDQPADQVPTCDFVGGALILSDFPVAVAVDGVKYYGNDANTGHAFSYAATGNLFEAQAMPLVQKGNPATGMGPTSGINFMNPNAQATLVAVTFINPSGFNASNYGTSMVLVPGYATGFVYTMFQENLPNGFYGSAIVVSELPIASTSANVDYQVQGDGTAIWNLFNPCGLFRQVGDCSWEDIYPWLQPRDALRPE
jgi:fimbrial isopeptide formation D2 family protein/uncharacterized repeat protein (TIGR01451 family)